MDKLKRRVKTEARRRYRIKKKIRANKDRLRLCFNRSNKNFYAQIIDDKLGKTLVGISTLSKDFPNISGKGNKAAAAELGKLVAEKAKAEGIVQVIFDRNGLLYHGKVKAFADAARENGLEF